MKKVFVVIMLLSVMLAPATRAHAGGYYYGGVFNPLWLPAAVISTAAAIVAAPLTILSQPPAYYGPPVASAPAYYGPPAPMAYAPPRVYYRPAYRYYGYPRYYYYR